MTRNEMLGSVGADLGTSDWFDIDQERVNLFADATLAHQWIQVDGEAAGQDPCDGPIGPGYLTLCLGTTMAGTVFEVEGVRMGINYGLNRVRFPATMPIGARLRVRLRLQSVREVAADTLECVFEETVEASGVEKPVCYAETVARLVF